MNGPSVIPGSRIPGGDRPTSNPGGCECESCGGIFIGAPGDYTCAVCLAIKYPNSAGDTMNREAQAESSVQSADDLLREVYHKIKPCAFRHAENCWRCGWFTRTEQALGLPFESHLIAEGAKQ